MKLGTQTGSLVNHIYSRGVIGQPDAAVGMGATMLGWTDRYPGTVIEVFKIGKSIALAVQEDDAKRIDKNGMSESQDYEFTPNPKGRVSHFKQKDDGTWVNVYKDADTNRWKQTGSRGLRLGERDKYYDFSF
ncbi:hypothetical protein [Synechococcus phage BUCT-ZZ01]|nr:hypothetical protein [Synechococcus phage BUCT-ZZ01]